MQPFLIQLIDLTLIQLTNWRWSWRGMIIVSLVAPVLSTVALGVFAADGGATALAYVITGNMVLSLLFGTVGRVSGNFAYMRVAGTLDYFATLPIQRVALVTATVIAFLVLSLPSAAATLLVGVIALGLPLALSPWIVVVVPVISMALCGLGALIGTLGRTPEEVNSISTLATFTLVALGPVVIPPNRLPAAILAVSFLSPATYAASALRQVVFSLPDAIPLVADLAVLIAVMLGLLWLAGRHMGWRSRQ